MSLSCFMPVSKLSGDHCEFKDGLIYSVRLYLNLKKNSKHTFPSHVWNCQSSEQVCKGRQEVASGCHCPGHLCCLYWVIFLIFIFIFVFFLFKMKLQGIALASFELLGLKLSARVGLLSPWNSRVTVPKTLNPDTFLCWWMAWGTFVLPLHLGWKSMCR